MPHKTDGTSLAKDPILSGTNDKALKVKGDNLSADTRNWIVKRRQLDMEARQDMINLKKRMRNIEKCIRELKKIKQEDKWKVPAIKATLDAEFKLLNKLLPDVKAYDSQVQEKVHADINNMTTEQLMEIASTKFKDVN